MLLYHDHIGRVKKGEQVGTNVQKRIPEHREWVNAVFDVIVFLTVNGIPFRGYDENTDFRSESDEGGVCINTFTDFRFRRKSDLKAIAKRLPLNAKYTSPQIRYRYIV